MPMLLSRSTIAIDRDDVQLFEDWIRRNSVDRVSLSASVVVRSIGIDIPTFSFGSLVRKGYYFAIEAWEAFESRGKMKLENSQNNALAKLPMLKLGEYEMWEIRIKQYFQIQDYALWEVIENGNSWVPISVTTPESGPSTALKMTVPSTTEEKICKKNDVKARSLLLVTKTKHEIGKSEKNRS
ncbi:hypothetical protein Tco_0215839 [Tanacetum coccineum]